MHACRKGPYSQYSCWPENCREWGCAWPGHEFMERENHSNEVKGVMGQDCIPWSLGISLVVIWVSARGGLLHTEIMGTQDG